VVAKTAPVFFTVVSQEPLSWKAVGRKLICSSQKTKGYWFREIIVELGIGYSVMQKIIKTLGYQKI
jgi:hypothetical protein